MGLTRWDQDQVCIRAICAQLVGNGVVEPLADRPDDDRAWNGWELASLIEGNYGQQIDGGTLTDDQRMQWELRANGDHRPLLRPHSEYAVSHWLLDDGARVGTIKFATMFKANSLFEVSSLFVAPAFRRRGIARRALHAAYRAALAEGASGLVLSTNWTWQRSVRFYLHIGMWVRLWKRALQLMWDPDLPAYRVEIGDAKARFMVETSAGFDPWLEAEPHGERLGWRELHAYQAMTTDRHRLEAWHDAPGTFALHLALAAGR